MRVISKLMPASKMKLVISSIGVLALVVFSGLVLFDATKAEVVLNDNGEKQKVKTHATTIDQLLKEAGITVGEHDLVSHEMDAAIENGMEVNYKTAKQIFVTIDGAEQEYYTTADTVEAFLKENSLSFADHDEVSHDMQTALEDGLHIDVNQAYQVTIHDGNKEIKQWTTGGSVKDLLEKAGVAFDPKSDDKIKPKLDDTLSKKTSISIVRVEKDEEEVSEAIAFETEEREDSSLPKGEERVISEGEEGTVKKVYEIVIENGKEASRELVSEEVTKESKNRVVAIGTKVEQPQVAKKQEPADEGNLVTLSEEKPKESKQPSSNGKVFTMSASAYTAGCSGCSGHTSTGIDLHANPNMKVIAVDPNVIPLGSKVWVEGYGEAIAADTGGHIVGNRIDVHVPSKSAAYSWGRKTVTVKVLD
ncbi:ubiquitin-like domain-containing protein [Oceanobacillus kapialis]|uniref:Ubiquitin-like domain-containing protein n=1 Tax=Oceanobacillus kapialis TaxID=481353 RepID=A0ABW5PXN2_9BACI